MNKNDALKDVRFWSISKVYFEWFVDWCSFPYQKIGDQKFSDDQHNLQYLLFFDRHQNIIVFYGFMSSKFFLI